jgi:hypothetical protein
VGVRGEAVCEGCGVVARLSQSWVVGQSPLWGLSREQQAVGAGPCSGPACSQLVLLPVGACLWVADTCG